MANMQMNKPKSLNGRIGCQPNATCQISYSAITLIAGKKVWRNKTFPLILQIFRCSRNANIFFVDSDPTYSVSCMSCSKESFRAN